MSHIHTYFKKQLHQIAHLLTTHSNLHVNEVQICHRAIHQRFDLAESHLLIFTCERAYTQTI